MGETCEQCGCELACPICCDASVGLVNDIDILQQKVDQLRAIVNKLPVWAGDLVQAQNQLHGVPHSGMAKSEIQGVEKALRKAAERSE